MEYVATEQIWEPLNDDGAAVLLYAVGDVVVEEDVARFEAAVAPRDSSAAAETDADELGDDESGEADGFEVMTRDQLVNYFNEHRPEGTTPLSRGSRKVDALRAVRTL